MKQHLLVTTASDLSIEQFRPFCDVFLLDNNQLSDRIRPIENYRSLYIRSHFSKLNTMPQNFTEQINKFGRLAQQYNIPVIDGMDTVEAIVNFEDKWHQYQLFNEFMPNTQLATESVSDEPMIFKKRISSRATGIAWRREDIVGDPANWICQSLLDIKEELRVYVVCGQVIEVVAVRQSKTTNQPIKVIGVRKLTKVEMTFAESIYQNRPELDFVGLDIVVTPKGLKLIEVNRSPDFASFAREGQLNLAEILYNRLRQK